MNPLHPVLNSIHNEKSFGITQRRSASGTPQFVPANSSTKNNKEFSKPLTPLITNESISSSRPQSPKSPIIPTIADFMIHDEDYGNGKKQSYYAASHPHNQYSYNIQCAKFCTYFSFIAILFLVTVGILIEVQPLYIKGVSPERVPLSFRKMRESHGGDQSEKELLSYVHYSGRLRMLQSYYLHQKDQSSSSSSSTFVDSSSILNTPRLGTYDDDPTTNYVKYNEYLRNLSNEQKEYIVYEMKAEAKTSFKAAALYFVVMVFCIIYTHNLERMHLLIGIGFHMWIRRMKNLVLHGGWRHCFVFVLNRYRRREYRDIPERNVFRGSGSPNINSALDARGMMTDPTSIAPRIVSADLTSESRNTSYESMIGLSLRERDLIAGGGHFEHKGQNQLISDASFDDIEYKPKNK